MTEAYKRCYVWTDNIMFRHRKKLNIIWLGISIVAVFAMVASLFVPFLF